MSHYLAVTSSKMMTTNRVRRVNTALTWLSSAVPRCPFHGPFPSNAFASSSTALSSSSSASLCPLRPATRQYHSRSYQLKGKGRALESPSISPSSDDFAGISSIGRQLTSSSPEGILLAYRIVKGREQLRHFHSTSRRDAIPLIPATIGILKVGLYRRTLTNDSLPPS